MKTNVIIKADCLAWMRPQPTNCVDLVFGSPPYAEKGERYAGGRHRWCTEDWVEWMLAVTKEAVRLSRGWVLWVVNGAVRGGRYFPACEGLAWEWYKRDGWNERSVIWHKNAPPNRRDWFGNDWEYVMAFKKPGTKPTFHWEAVATPPKYQAGGRFRQRSAKGGQRRLGSAYPRNRLARPRDVVRFTVGGGHLGSKLAHGNEAPFPQALAEHFILACCPPGGLVYDPFAGSGTTGAAALATGRRFLMTDVRQCQIKLARERITEAMATCPPISTPLCQPKPPTHA